MFDPNYQPAPDLLRDRIIAITGAGDGIGRTLALSCANHGATVILIGRTQAKLEAVYDAIEAAGGPQPALLPMDFAVIEPEQYGTASEVIAQEFGRLDGLVHNAGVLGQRTPLGSYRPDVWDTVLKVNLTAPFLLTRALLPQLKASDAASVVFTSSGVAERGRAYWGAYAVSKAGVDNLMETLADEVEDIAPIRANSINPGATRTAMRAAAYPAEDPQTVKPPEALLPLYLWLLGPDSAGVNGQRFNFPQG